MRSKSFAFVRFSRGFCATSLVDPFHVVSGTSVPRAVGGLCRPLPDDYLPEGRRGCLDGFMIGISPDTCLSTFP